jgi:hypothetical protein
VAKLTYLQLINRVLKRITQPEIITVASCTGQAKIISELINEAQNELWTETTNWYPLYATRTIATVASTATYAVATDWGRTIDMMNVTSGIMMTEDLMRSFDETDPDANQTGVPTHFAVQGEYYVLYPIPADIYSLRERYWKVPATLSVDADTSVLPLFCENFIIHWAWMSILEYMNKFEQADRIRLKIYGNPATKEKGILDKCKLANNKIVDRMIVMGGGENYGGIRPPKFPSAYGVS